MFFVTFIYLQNKTQTNNKTNNMKMKMMKHYDIKLFLTI